MLYTNLGGYLYVSKYWPFMLIVGLNKNNNWNIINTEKFEQTMWFISIQHDQYPLTFLQNNLENVLFKFLQIRLDNPIYSNKILKSRYIILKQQVCFEWSSYRKGNHMSLNNLIYTIEYLYDQRKTHLKTWQGYTSYI